MAALQGLNSMQCRGFPSRLQCISLCHLQQSSRSRHASWCMTTDRYHDSQLAADCMSMLHPHPTSHHSLLAPWSRPQIHHPAAPAPRSSSCQMATTLRWQQISGTDEPH